MITDTGRFVDKQGNSLQFDYDFESLDQTVDIDPQEQEMANRVGVVGVDGLAGPGKMTLDGLWTVTPDQRTGNTVYRTGEVTRFEYDPPERYWQALVGGRTSDEADYQGFVGAHELGDTAVDGEVTWVYRGASLWQCIRFIKDMWLKFLGQGIIKLYLDDDRFTFVQATNINLPSWDGLATALRWSVTFSRHDPRWYDDTLTETGLTMSGGYALWAPGLEALVGDKCVPTLGNHKWYEVDPGGTTGDTEPPFDVGPGPWDDDGSAVTWESSIGKEVGDRVIPTGAHTCWYEATAAVGTKMTGNAEPSPWPTTPGDTVVDNEVTWTCRAMPVWTYGGAVTQRTMVTSVVNLGTAKTAPIVRLTVPRVTLDVTVTNVTTDQFFTIRGNPGSSGEIEVDCLEGTVRMGTVDKMNLFDGEFLSLDLGPNEIDITWSDPGPSNVRIQHRDQYW